MSVGKRHDTPEGQTMTRLAWMTDLHLNFLTPAERRRFLDAARDQADAFVISGDIAESRDVVDTLLEMQRAWQKPLYFVLGNHDFYRGSIRTTRAEVARLAESESLLTYLTATSVVELSPQTALVGHDGWADARLGDFDGSTVILNDYLQIEELRHWGPDSTLDKTALADALHRLGDEAARHFEGVLLQAVDRYPTILATTHVPPFKQAAWYDGKHSDDYYLPHFACQAVGQVMQRVMQAHPQSRLLVLCGHTHGRGEVQISENLQVLTGGAEYGRPEIQQVLEIA
jgi:predicted MPP superfamily phosphohydrolase